MINSSEFFETNKYLVVKNLIDKNTADLLYAYCLTTVQRADHIQTFYPQMYHADLEGGFGDSQSPSFKRYGDPLMDTVMALMVNKFSEYTGLPLIPNYTYWRLYEHGDDLRKHLDRFSCEISATICLGEDNSMVDQSVYPNYHWPIFVESNEEEIPIALEPGDGLIYKGTEVPHWRETFKGTHQAQLFIHYNNANNTNEKFDGRPILGVFK